MLPSVQVTNIITDTGDQGQHLARQVMLTSKSMTWHDKSMTWLLLRYRVVQWSSW